MLNAKDAVVCAVKLTRATDAVAATAGKSQNILSEYFQGTQIITDFGLC